MKVIDACYVCNSILVEAGHLQSKFLFVYLWNMNRFNLWFSDTASIPMLNFVLENFITDTGATM
jgi:hypothetical protein